MKRSSHAVFNQSAKGTEMTDSIRNSSKKKNLNLYKTLQEECLTALDGFSRKVNQKVNLPDDARPDFAILKDGFLKTRPIKKFQICLKM